MTAFLSRLKLGAAVALVVPALAGAQTRTITFDAGGAGGALAVGSILSNQYAGVGVTFSPNAITGAGWATNTSMRIVSSTGPDVGGLGTPSLVSGNLLRSFNEWLNENGDPSFRMTFSDPFIDFVSIDIAGIAGGEAGKTSMFLYNGSTLLGTVTAPGNTTGQNRLSFTALAGQNITSVVVTPGSFFDWAGVDNITYGKAETNVVPEPGTWALLSTGLVMLGGVAARRRKVPTA